MKKTILLGIGALLFWSCNNSAKTTAPEEEVTHTETHTEHHHNESSDAIELNNGEKWIVNEEMKPFVLKGEELVNTFMEENNMDYATLAAQIKEQNTQLIKSCTMTGKSHDELHKWLHPHLELVQELAETTDETQAKASVQKLEESYQDYHKYFQ